MPSRRPFVCPPGLLETARASAAVPTAVIGTGAALASYTRHGVDVSVDFSAGFVYYLLGVPDDPFVPIFAVGRVPGWTLQALEQRDRNNPIRPRLHYTGPRQRDHRPIEAR